jgi:hypothetical protein
MAGASYEKPDLELQKYISSVSDKYAFGYAVNILDGNTKTYSYQTSLDYGIASPKDIVFDVSAIKKVDVKYDVDSTSSRTLFPITWSGITDKNGWVGVTFYDENAQPLAYPFIQTAYYGGNHSNAFPLFHLREGYRY